MATPRCPHCNAQGIDKIAAKKLGGYSLIYCDKCGAIYGVVPAIQSHSQPADKKNVPETRHSSRQKKQPPTPKNKSEAEALMQFYGRQYRGTNYMKFYIPEDDDDSE